MSYKSGHRNNYKGHITLNSSDFCSECGGLLSVSYAEGGKIRSCPLCEEKKEKRAKQAAHQRRHYARKVEKNPLPRCRQQLTAACKAAGGTLLRGKKRKESGCCRACWVKTPEGRKEAALRTRANRITEPKAQQN